jgi:hypothetical protein
MTGLVDLSRVLVLAAALGGLAAPALAQQSRYPYSLTLYDQPDYRGGSVTFYGDNANIGSTGFANRARSAQIRGTWRLCEGGGYRSRCEVLNVNIPDLETYGFSRRVGSAQLLGPATTTPAPRQPPPQEPAPRGPAPGPEARPYGPGAPAIPYESLPQEPPAVDAPLAAPSRFGRPPYATPPALPPSSWPAPPAAAIDDAGSAQGGTAVFFPVPTLRGASVAAWTPGAADSFCRTRGLGEAIYFDQSQVQRDAVDVSGRPAGEGPVLRDVLCRR